MSGIVGNADTWTVVFKDANGTPVDPDGDVVWTITVGHTRTTITQAREESVSTGTYQLVYTPTKAEPYTVKLSADVDGAPQSPEAVRRSVRA